MNEVISVQVFPELQGGEQITTAIVTDRHPAPFDRHFFRSLDYGRFYVSRSPRSGVTEIPFESMTKAAQDALHPPKPESDGFGFTL